MVYTGSRIIHWYRLVGGPFSAREVRSKYAPYRDVMGDIEEIVISEYSEEEKTAYTHVYTKSALPDIFLFHRTEELTNSSPLFSRTVFVSSIMVRFHTTQQLSPGIKHPMIEPGKLNY